MIDIFYYSINENCNLLNSSKTKVIMLNYFSIFILTVLSKYLNNIYVHYITEGFLLQIQTSISVIMCAYLHMAKQELAKVIP